PEATHERGRSEHQQGVAEDRPHQRGLDDLLQAVPQGEESDDDLGRVAEGDVQQPADARARAIRELLGRLAHECGGGDHADGGYEEDRGRGSCSDVEHDRQRNERNEEVRPPLAAEQEATQGVAGYGRWTSHLLPSARGAAGGSCASASRSTTSACWPCCDRTSASPPCSQRTPTARARPTASSAARC